MKPKCGMGNHWMLISLCWAVGIGLWHASGGGGQSAFLNQIANGPVNGPGFLTDPLLVSNVGPDGQVVVDEGPATSSDTVYAYAADGSYLQRLAFNGTGNQIQSPFSSAIGPDGTYYVVANGSQSVAVVNGNGVLQHALPNTGAITFPTGVAVSSAGTLYVANENQILVYSTLFNGTTYPALGSFGSAGSEKKGSWGGNRHVTLDASSGRICTWQTRLTIGLRSSHPRATIYRPLAMRPDPDTLFNLPVSASAARAWFTSLISVPVSRSSPRTAALGNSCHDRRMAKRSPPIAFQSHPQAWCTRQARMPTATASSASSIRRRGLPAPIYSPMPMPARQAWRWAPANCSAPIDTRCGPRV